MVRAVFFGSTLPPAVRLAVPFLSPGAHKDGGPADATLWRRRCVTSYGPAQHASAILARAAVFRALEGCSAGSIDTARTAAVGRVPCQLCILQRVGCFPKPALRHSLPACKR